MIGKTETLDEEVRLYPHFNFAKHPELAKALPVIVPPVSSKNVRVRMSKEDLAFDFIVLLRMRTDLYIIGYSLPKEDQFARLVLRRALRSNLLRTTKSEKGPVRITVVNPDESTGVTFSRLAGPKVSVTYYQAKLRRLRGLGQSWNSEDN